ncbi:uncharacterized protein LOC134840072 [Symsagittifera roscoffensis]|uniref:uncharacterized protein LOC134840072 n=1 Tax=Symsagittifera roscoffensis TaxID=84072 RepID=UPI00307BDD2A
MMSFGPIKILSAVVLMSFCCHESTMTSLEGKVEAKPQCTEECLRGFERVEGLDHCYKMLIDLGPVSQDKAVTACGYEGGATLVTFDNVGDDQRLREHFWVKFHNNIRSSPAYLEHSGFWTGYVRFFGNVSNTYVNMYSGDPIDPSLFEPKQPDDRIVGSRGGEACVCRKDYGEKDFNWNHVHGLDDYTCAFPNWVVCMQRNVYMLNRKAWNSALMYGVNLPEDGTCQLDWERQNFYQLQMMKDKRLEMGYPGAQEHADLYMKILNDGAIQSPTCPQ